jgi:hypothetical protein
MNSAFPVKREDQFAVRAVHVDENFFDCTPPVFCTILCADW